MIDPQENTSYIRAVKDNLNIFLIGKANLDIAKEFVAYTGKPDLYPDVKKVTQQADPKYKHSFLLYNVDGEMQGSAVLKPILPPSLFEPGGLMHSRTADETGILKQSD